MTEGSKQKHQRGENCVYILVAIIIKTRNRKRENLYTHKTRSRARALAHWQNEKIEAMKFTRLPAAVN